jgi:4-hydroxy-2-oxoheptanedioate aldolase
MQTPVNHFKQALQRRKPQIGFWLNLANTVSTEIAAGAGFDWLLIDTEHSPNTLPTLLTQLQTVAAYPGTQAVVRVPVFDSTLIKQYLDMGAASILVPMIDTPEQAAEVVRACRYPQADGKGGVRGMAAARGSRWGRYTDYAQAANGQVGVLVQAESRLALKNLDAIAATEGVDGVFIGPSDLSADMGHAGHAGHPQVQAAVEDAIARILRAGKAPGILTVDESLSQRYLELGAVFVAVGLDTNILVRQTSALASRFKLNVQAMAQVKGGTY